MNQPIEQPTLQPLILTDLRGDGERRVGFITLNRAKQLSETVILGGGGGGGRTNTSILGEGGSVEKPMLGRYQVEKELGKGAMGVVYLGKDPKIGRVVAIKTMALSQEFEADELAEVKERFFREAETAGRLSNPNIVTIYDAGEEHDLAYIAMEFLKGRDLIPFTKPDALLPLPQVVSIVARVADALDDREHLVGREKIRLLGVGHQVLALEVLHRDVAEVVLLARVEDGDDIRVVQAPGGLRLAEEALLGLDQLLGLELGR